MVAGIVAGDLVMELSPPVFIESIESPPPLLLLQLATPNNNTTTRDEMKNLRMEQSSVL